MAAGISESIGPPARAVSLIRRMLRAPSGPTLFLCSAGILLPNVLSIGSMVLGIGMPPRTSAIIAYAAVVLIARLVPWPLTILLFLGVIIFDGIWTIALLFGLAPTEIVQAIHLAGELKLFESPLYMGMIGTAALLLAVNLAALTRLQSRMVGGSAGLLVTLAIGVAALDLFANTSLHYQFGALYGAHRPIEAASDQSGFRDAALTGTKRHVLLVIVEALGQFANPDHRAILLEPMRHPGLLQRYTVTTGSTTYYGSTTAAEMRELCATREAYGALLEGKQFDCLPAQMAARGYQTSALHGFTSHFFDRDAWYPKLGFEQLTFGENLRELPKRRCGGPFKGPCDADLLPILGRQLHEATKPIFAYWLTLSTHVPIAPQEGTPRLGCENGGAIGHVEVCYMTEMWLDVLTGLARLAAKIPPTEILIVGDHAPPLWSKAGRNLFVPGQVPWVRLSPRSSTLIAPQ